MLSCSFQLFERNRASTLARPIKPLIPKLTPKPTHDQFTKPPPGLKRPFVVRPFQKDGHIANMQFIENRGMYKEELDIERARFPRMTKTLAIHCDGALCEREFEFAVPPVLVVFRDRHSVHLEELAEHRRLRSDGWRCLRGVSAPVKEERPEAVHEQRWNLLCFPYCVPTKLPMRAQSCLQKKKTKELRAAAVDASVGDE